MSHLLEPLSTTDVLALDGDDMTGRQNSWTTPSPPGSDLLVGALREYDGFAL